MRAINDLTGMVFVRLTVIEMLPERSRGGKILWKCVCECGKEVSVQSSNLTCGHTLSCGCLGKENRTTALTKHGWRHTPEYNIWCGIIQRCNNPSNDRYDDYGGRGIKVCDRWRESFSHFLADMGPRPDGAMTIDRFPDNNGNYEPGNCRWATSTQQGRHKRNNRLVTLDGETKVLSEWEEIKGLNHSTVQGRVRSGWTYEEALSHPTMTEWSRQEKNI